jgi:hypothetical protein
MRNDRETKPSELFLNSLAGGGQIEIDCSWCNRYHMCPNTRYWDHMSYSQEAYIEACQNEFNKNPEGVILHYGMDGVYYRIFNDMAFPDDCPCNGLSYFETMIWNNRDSIENYLKVRYPQEQQWLKEEQLIEKLNQSTKCQVQDV